MVDRGVEWLHSGVFLGLGMLQPLLDGVAVLQQQFGARGARRSAAPSGCSARLQWKIGYRERLQPACQPNPRAATGHAQQLLTDSSRFIVMLLCGTACLWHSSRARAEHLSRHLQPPRDAIQQVHEYGNVHPADFPSANVMSTA
jgi:hypothetical protein